MNDTAKQRVAGGEVLERKDQGPVAVLTLNRPDARNSLSEELIAAITGAIKEVGNSDAVRAVVVTGAGSAFSSGHDLKELTAHRSDKDRGRAFFDKTLKACSEMMLSIVHCPKPVIAAVNGVATAAGCQLVATCDLAVAADHATFATPGVNIGLFCSTPMVPIERTIGRKRALEMLFTGNMIDAATAADWGLVNRVVPIADLEPEVFALAVKIAQSSPLVLALGKRAFYEQEGLDERAAYGLACAVMVDNAQADDAHEGMRAFLEKRKPEWKR
jgi:enoyl-CoA hydratase/carnithine racemase